MGLQDSLIVLAHQGIVYESWLQVGSLQFNIFTSLSTPAGLAFSLAQGHSTSGTDLLRFVLTCTLIPCLTVA